MEQNSLVMIDFEGIPTMKRYLHNHADFEVKQGEYVLIKQKNIELKMHFYHQTQYKNKKIHIYDLQFI